MRSITVSTTIMAIQRRDIAVAVTNMLRTIMNITGIFNTASFNMSNANINMPVIELINVSFQSRVIGFLKFSSFSILIMFKVNNV